MKIMKNILTILAPVSAVVVMTACSSDSSDAGGTNSAIGELDPSFNGVGYVTDDNVSGGSGDDEGRSLVIDADGKIVVAGSSFSDTLLYDDMVIWRYNCDGTPDTTFNGTGYVTDDSSAGNNGGNDNGNSVVLDADGKIVVAGYSATLDMIIWRYNSDGDIDTTFNGIGYVTHHDAAGGGTYDYGKAVTIDANGKILVTGSSRNSSGKYDMVIWRYNSSGSLDSTFNGVGFAVHSGAAGGSGHDYGNAITTDADSKVLVAGASENINNLAMTLWRYDSNGSLDSTFNGVGYVTDNNASGGSSNDGGYAIAIDADGKIIVAGYSTNLINTYDMVIWRYDSNGSLDTTFNGVGYVMHNGAAGGAGFDIGYSVTIDANGKIVVAGTSQNSNDYDLAIWRYRSDGTLDTTFNGVGYVTDHNASGGDRDDMGYAVVIDAKGNLVTTGISDNAVNEDMAIWRYK
ncbi:MAG: delta-60 repeat domain-containing protein [Campylobacterota bacterium]